MSLVVVFGIGRRELFLFLLWLPFLETTGSRWLRYPVHAGAIRKGNCALSYLSSSSTVSIAGTEAAQSSVQQCWLNKDCVFYDKEWQQSYPQPAAGRAGRALQMWPCCQSRASPAPCPAPASQPALYTHKHGVCEGFSVQNLDCWAKDGVKREGRDTRCK